MKKNILKPFTEARQYARSLGLKSHGEWEDFVAGGNCPFGIPKKPNLSYRYEGWSGFADWLGYEPAAAMRFRSFRNARHFTRTLGISSVREWDSYCAGNLPGKGPKPSDIPSKPDRTYAKKGWISWNDWLGNGMVEHNGRTYEPFTDARKFARSLGLADLHGWFSYCRGEHGSNPLPGNIPAFPYEAYKFHGWAGWNDWLGRKLPPKHEREYRSFDDARKFTRSLKLNRTKLWRKYCGGEIINREPLPDDIPACPDEVYGEWVSWGDWLGTGHVHGSRRKFRSFTEARNFVRNLGLRNEDEWRLYCRTGLPGKGKIPLDIPTNPHRNYKAEWKGMGDWLGTGNIANYNREYLPFGRAKSFARRLRLKNVNEWRMRCKGFPADIPRNPNVVYRLNGWISWGDWLGTGAVHASRRNFLVFKEARIFARKLKFKNIYEWRRYAKGELPGMSKPDNIPSNPEGKYQDEWKGWRDFLGNESSRKTRSADDEQTS